MNYYNKIAKGYDELHRQEQSKKIDIIKEDIQLKGLALDIGCGTGLSSKPFNAIGLDKSFNMLKEGNLKRCVNAEAENIPFKNGVFNSIISLTAFHNFSDIKKVIEEIKRITKPQAIIVVSILKKSKNLDRIKMLLIKNFNLKTLIEEEKDLIVILSKV